MDNKAMAKTMLKLIKHIDNLHDEIKLLREETSNSLRDVGNRLEELDKYIYPEVNNYNSSNIRNNELIQLKFELEEYVEEDEVECATSGRITMVNDECERRKVLKGTFAHQSYLEQGFREVRNLR